MTPAMPSTHPCPDLEDLAAFADGRLAAGRRAAVVEHLASCEGCYEVYAETLRVSEELAAVEDEPANDELAPVVVHPRSFRWAWPAAAALAAAAAIVLVLRLPDFLSTSRTSGELVAAAGIGPESRLGNEWDVHGWTETRGSTNPYGRLSPEERWFRIGVRVVDLRGALAIGGRDVASGIVAQIVLLLESEEFAIQNILYEPMREALESDAPTESLIEMGSQAEEHLFPENAAYFELGKWVEAARLAAIAGEARYFESREFRGFLRRLPREELPASVVEKLAELETLIKTEPDTKALADLLAKIIALRSLSG